MTRDQLIGDLYEAAFRHDSFLEVMHQVSETLGANYFHMFSWDTARNAPRLSIYSPRSELDAQISLYDQYYGALDPRRGLVERAAVGELVACQDYLTDQDVARSEFYQDYQLQAGIRYLMGVRLGRPGGDDILLGLLRSDGRTPYSREDRISAAGLTGHLHRAINLWQDAAVLHRDAGIGAELMEELGLAVLALDRHQRITYVNLAAEALLRGSAGVRRQHQCLVAATAPENDALQAAMSRVARSRQTETLALRGTTGAAHSLFMSITALPESVGRTVFGNAALMITIRQRGGASLVVAQQLREAFGLSKAEAAVAEALLAGKSPEECAEVLGVTLPTVRSQLRAIFQKTQTRNQAEAVSTMLWVLPRREATG